MIRIPTAPIAAGAVIPVGTVLSIVAAVPSVGRMIPAVIRIAVAMLLRPLLRTLARSGHAPTGRSTFCCARRILRRRAIRIRLLRSILLAVVAVSVVFLAAAR